MPASNLRFLVIEDHALQRKALANTLTSIGAAAVHATEDGAAALKVLRDPNSPVDIVLSDLSMPGMDGLEFVRHVGEAGDRVSLILASALDRALISSIGNMARAYNVNLLGVIEKPCTAAKLAPLFELHRTQGRSVDGAERTFPLSEIAAGWTDNQFQPAFIPRVEVATGAVAGMHAVPCWQHPDQGLLEGEAFLPSMRARGLNDDFSWLMLQSAFEQAARWQAEGHPWRVSVAMSFSSLTDLSLASRIRELAARAGVPASALVLTVSESALSRDLGRTLENLARLRVDGFGLAIDDFGSGHMAFDKLSLVAFTELIIHSSFIVGAPAQDTVRAGLAAGLELAQELRLKTVAQGVARLDEWKLLQRWGCDLASGPLLSPALDSGQITAWAAAFKAPAA